MACVQRGGGVRGIGDETIQTVGLPPSVSTAKKEDITNSILNFLPSGAQQQETDP